MKGDTHALERGNRCGQLKDLFRVATDTLIDTLQSFFSVCDSSCKIRRLSPIICFRHHGSNK